MKRKFLTTLDFHKYLSENSSTCKRYKYKDKNSYMYEFDGYSCVLEEYKEKLAGLVLLVVLSENDIVLDDFLSELVEITDDVKYTKKYLNLFGNPQSYEFDIQKVLDKFDRIGLVKMDLNFPMGVSTSKVFKIILYRLNQFYKSDQQVKKLKKAYKLAKKVFDKEIIENLLKTIDDVDTYDLNFKAFIQETSFYETKLSQQAIYFFDKKKKLFDLI